MQMTGDGEMILALYCLIHQVDIQIPLRQRLIVGPYRIPRKDKERKQLHLESFRIPCIYYLIQPYLLSFITDPQERYLIDRLESLFHSDQFQLLVPET
jgi:hypothetical protein